MCHAWAENVAALGGAPLLVARPRRQGTCVLGIVSTSHGSDGALETALQEARLAHKRPVLLHCLNTGFLAQRSTDLLAVERDGPGSSMTTLLSLRAREQLNWELRRRNVAADLRVADGDPAYLVLR